MRCEWGEEKKNKMQFEKNRAEKLEKHRLKHRHLTVERREESQETLRAKWSQRWHKAGNQTQACREMKKALARPNVPRPQFSRAHKLFEGTSSGWCTYSLKVNASVVHWLATSCSNILQEMYWKTRGRSKQKCTREVSVAEMKNYLCQNFCCRLLRTIGSQKWRCS